MQLHARFLGIIQGFRELMSCARDVGRSCDKVSKDPGTCSHVSDGGFGYGERLDVRQRFHFPGSIVSGTKELGD